MPTVAPTTSLAFPQGPVKYHEPFELSVTLDNESANGSGEVGYGPFVDLLIPPTVESVPDAAQYLGLSLNPVQTYTWDATLGEWSGAPEVHPLSRNNDPTASNAILPPDGSGLADGTEWRVYQLPFGSFTPEQPQATLTFSGAELDSTTADLSVRGGISLGILRPVPMVL